MKKFELTVNAGNSLLYKAVLTFNEEEEAKYLKEIQSKDFDFNNFMDGEFEAMGLEHTGDDLPQLVKDDPDTVIIAGIRTQCFSLMPKEDVDTLWPVKAEVTCMNIQQYDWECKRIA